MEKAITLPLDWVERLLELAEDAAPDDDTVLVHVRAEIAQVREMIRET